MERLNSKVLLLWNWNYLELFLGFAPLATNVFFTLNSLIALVFRDECWAFVIPAKRAITSPFISYCKKKKKTAISNRENYRQWKHVFWDCHGNNGGFTFQRWGADQQDNRWVLFKLHFTPVHDDSHGRLHHWTKERNISLFLVWNFFKCFFVNVGCWKPYGRTRVLTLYSVCFW